MGDESGEGGAQAAEIRAFLIADIRGYTVFTNTRGDEAAGRLAGRFAEITRAEVEGFGGRLLELRGDEALVTFSSPRQAIRAAVQLQGRYIDETLADPSLPLTVGIGLDAGEAVQVEGGYRGGALNLAARLCSQARAGEVLASQGIVHLARRVDGIVYRDRGALHLKGLDEPVRALLVGPVGPDRSHLVAAHVPRWSGVGARTRGRRVALGAALASIVVAAAVVAVVRSAGSNDGRPVGTPHPTVRPSPEASFGLGAERIDPARDKVDATAEFRADSQEAVIAGGFVWALEAEHPNVNLVKIRPDPVAVIATVKGLFLHPVGADGAVYSIVETGSGGWLSRVDPTTNEVQRLVRMTRGLQGLASVDGRVWWGIPWDGVPDEPGIVRIDVTTKQQRRIPVRNPEPFVCDFQGCRPNAIAAGEGGIWFVTTSRTLDRLDPHTLRVEPVAVDGATAVAVGLGSVWVVDGRSNPGVVRQYDPFSARVVQEYEVGANPTAIAVGAGAVWVLNRDDGTLSRIDPAQRKVVSTIPVGGGPRALAADDRLGVWVVR